MANQVSTYTHKQFFNAPNVQKHSTMYGKVQEHSSQLVCCQLFKEITV